MARVGTGMEADKHGRKSSLEKGQPEFKHKGKAPLVILLLTVFVPGILLTLITGCENRSNSPIEKGPSVRPRSYDLPELQAKPAGGVYTSSNAARDDTKFFDLDFQAVPQAHAATESTPAEQMKVYVAKVDLEVRQLTDEIERVKEIAERFDGYIVSSFMEQSNAMRYVRATIRVPSEKYREALSELEKLGELVSKEEDVEDVTMEYMDSSARLANLKKEETSVAALLQRQGELSDILDIEKELARIRTEIETIEGRLRYLENQVAYSTIRVNIDERAPMKEYEGWPLGETFGRAKRGLLYFSRVILSALVYVAVFSPYLIGLYLIYRLGRYWRRRKS